MKKRADQQLFDLGLVKSRSQARDLIKQQKVKYKGELVKKASSQVGAEDLLIEGESHYVSRGYLKLKSFCELKSLDFTDKVIADFGASTGGFTQYALENSAAKVYCIDVGTDQLDASLLNNPKVINMPNTNIRDGLSLDDPIALAVVDLSFISLTLVTEEISKPLQDHAEVIALVKPQFEVGKDGLDKKGLVKEDLEVIEILKLVEDDFFNKELIVELILPSGVAGKTGNQEYFFYAIKRGPLHKRFTDWETL